MGRILTDTTRSVLGVLGKVKIGEKASKNGKEYPKSIDYFRFTSNEQKRVDTMLEMFGAKPTKLPVTFHDDDTDLVCDQRYELRDSAGKLVAYGNGKTFHESHKDGFVQKPDMDVQKAERYMSSLSDKVGREWRETLTLRFMVMGYPELGLWEFRTGGKETSIGQIIGSFDTVMEQAGRVKGIPFWLTVKKHISNRANTNRQYPVTNLVCDLSREHVERVLQLGNTVRGLITPQKLQLELPTGTSQPSLPNQEEYTDFEEIKDDRPLLKKSDPKFDNAVKYFFENGAEFLAIDKVRKLDEAAKEYFLALEQWKSSYDSGNIKLDELRSKIDKAHWVYFKIKEHQPV